MTCRFLTLLGTASLPVLAACNDVTAPTRQVALASARFSIETVPQPVERFYGPERFARTQGAPNSYTRAISTLRFEAPFTIHIRNGAADGSQRALGGDVTLDGKRILSQQDFARQREWALPVPLGTTATLEVSLAGAPGGYLEIWIEGKRSYPVFCPNGPAGSYPTLSEAVDAVWIGGTVLVCDGEHRVDLVFLNKPLTLRSQNSGGATLADADASQVYQGGRPALVINGVEAGGVRIADLTFLVGNRAIFAGGTFDQVEIDSVHFRGRSLTVPIGVWVGASTVGSAKVDVTRSRFEGLMHGVFPVRAVETNVSWSQFDSFGGGAVTYSGGTVNGVASASYGRTAHNTFTQCALAGCIRVVGPPQPSREVVIAHNVMTRPAGPTQSATIVVARAAPDVAAPRAPVIIEHNTATGAVIRNAASSAEQAWWSVGSFVNNVGGVRGSSVIVRHNRVTDYYVGLSASAPVTAHDNYFMSGHRAIMQQNTAVAVDFQRNDVYFEMSMWRIAGGGHTGNYRCNWWGSTAGPSHPSVTFPASSYTPWAAEPIAGTSVACDPTHAPPPSVVRVCSVALAEGPPTFPTVPEAYTAVTTGGTILICDGTHVVQDVRIDKAITIRGEGPGKPMLDAQGVRSNFDIRNVTGGAVVIRGLQFRGTWLSTDESPRPGYGANINIEGDYSTITVEDSDFHPSGQIVAYDMPAPGQPRLSYNSGIWFWNTSGNGITVRASTFTGGDIGVGGVGANLVVRSNSFRGQSNAAVHSGRGTTLVEDNDVSDCGTAWCIGAFSAEFATMRVVRNRITVAWPRTTSRAILVDVRDATVSDNIITGIGGTRTSRSTYPIMYAIAAHASRTNATTNYRIDGNTISGAYSGIDFASVVNFGTDGPVVGDASDNRISDVATPFSGSGGAGLLKVKLRRNDFSAYIGIDPDGQGRAFVEVDLTCNWWGSATGPTGYLPPAWVTLVQPVATEPIANNGGVACN